MVEKTLEADESSVNRAWERWSTAGISTKCTVDCRRFMINKLEYPSHSDWPDSSVPARSRVTSHHATCI